MKEIRGYVGMVKVPHSRMEVLLGPKLSSRPGMKECESFSANGLVAFDEEHFARNAATLTGNMLNTNKTCVGDVEIQIAETDEDLNLLIGAVGLIVVEFFTDFKPNAALRGEMVVGARSSYPIPGSFLTENGFVPFADFGRAQYVRSEVERQAQNPAKLATFRLTRLEK